MGVDVESMPNLVRPGSVIRVLRAMERSPTQDGAVQFAPTPSFGSEA
jgi:hypothetical protein